MKRLTLWTGLGLTLLYGALSLLCAESLPVTFQHCQLTTHEAILTLANDGSESLPKVLVVVKVYAGDRLVITSPLVEKRNLPGQTRAEVRLPLPKPLDPGTHYRVVAYAQKKGARPLLREFAAQPAVKTAAALLPERRSRTIDEPARLRRCINPIDPRAEMGLL